MKRDSMFLDKRLNIVKTSVLLNSFPAVPIKMAAHYFVDIKN